jgi:hypothetical protein
MPDSPIEARIEIDGVVVIRQERRHLALQPLKELVGVRPGDRMKRTIGSGQQIAASLQRVQRILDRWFGGVRRDCLDFGKMQAHSFVDRWSEMLIAYAIERRRLERQAAAPKQRISAAVLSIAGHDVLTAGG